MTLRLCLIATFLCSSSFSPISVRASDHPIRVLILSGKNNHDWRKTTPALTRVLQESGRFHVRVLDDPSSCTDRELGDCDVILSNWTNFPSRDRVWGGQAERAIIDFVRSGRGFVVVHAASACFPSWPEYQQLIGATWGDSSGHGPYRAFTVSVGDTTNPITRVIAGFTAEDELWHRMSRKPEAHVLCTAYSDTAGGGTGAWEPVAYCMPFGQGRSFNLVLGHDARAMLNPNWRLLLLRGTEWAATGEASIEIPYDIRGALRAASNVASPGREQLRELEQLVQSSSRNPALQRALAAGFCQMLGTSASITWKKRFCQLLSLVGGPSEVPSLARLLNDPQLGFSARFALERIAGGTSSDALREAAARAAGLPLIGELNALGEIKDTHATELLGQNLGGKHDPAVRGAAIHALGKIGGPDAARLLRGTPVDTSLRVLLSESLLRCAEAYESAGDIYNACTVYESLNTSRQPPHIRTAAFSGMIRCREDRASAMVLDALRSGDDVLGAALVHVLRGPAGSRVAGVIASRTSMLSETRRAQVFYALADVGERRVLKDMYAALRNGHRQLQSAALYGIGKLGDSSSVLRLCGVMRNADAPQREEIRNCLARLRGQGVDERLCSLLSSHCPSAIKEQAIFALAARDSRIAIPSLLAALKAGSVAVRKAAIDALGSLADGAISQDLVQMVKSERWANDRPALVRTLVKLALRDRTPERVCNNILTALPGSPPGACVSMFQILGRFGGGRAYRAVRSVLRDHDPEVQASAIRILSAWPDSAPLEDLFTIAHASGQKATRALAMRGAISLLENCPDLKEDERVRILERELGRVDSGEAEVLLISTLGKQSTVHALRLAVTCFDRPEVANEAALAVAGIVQAMGGEEAEEGERALERALQAVTSPSIAAQLRSALEGLQFQTGRRKIRVAVVTGGHDFDEPAFLGLFRSDTGITFMHTPQADESEIFEETAGWSYDVVVLYNMTKKISEKRRQNFLRLLDDGIGVLSLHHASGAFPEWCEYPKIIGCRYLHSPLEQNGVRWEPSTYRHDVDIPVHVADTAHAVTAGVHDFAVHDEAYHGCQFEPDNHLLLTTAERSSDEPLGWARSYRRSRVVHFQLGHGPEIFGDEQYRRLVAQAIRWCAEGRREQIVRDAKDRRTRQ